MQQSCDPDKWSSKAGRITGRTEDVRTINKYLDAVEHRIYDIHKNLVAEEKNVNVQTVRSDYLGETEKSQRLVDIYRYRHVHVTALVGIDFALGTLKKFKPALTSLPS